VRIEAATDTQLAELLQDVDPDVKSLDITTLVSCVLQP
jgi:hypothetical protein